MTENMRTTIETLKKLYKKTTPGEWHPEGPFTVQCGDRYGDGCIECEGVSSAGDAAFIIEVHNALPAILQRLEKLESFAAKAVPAMKKVPIVRRGERPPFSTCLGCASVDGDPCQNDCWAYRLEEALHELGK